MLARGSQRTAGHRRHPFLFKRRDGVLVHERVLTRGAGAERVLIILSSIVFPIQRIHHHTFIAHDGITYVRRVSLIPGSNSEKRSSRNRRLREWRAPVAVTPGDVGLICNLSGRLSFFGVLSLRFCKDTVVSVLVQFRA